MKSWCQHDDVSLDFNMLAGPAPDSDAKLGMHRMIFQGEYRGFIVWQEADKVGAFVRDPSHEWTECNRERFSSIRQAEEYIDFVIEHYRLNKPGKTLAAADTDAPLNG